MKISPLQDNACVGDVIRCCLRGVRLSGVLGFGCLLYSRLCLASGRFKWNLSFGMLYSYTAM